MTKYFTVWRFLGFSTLACPSNLSPSSASAARSENRCIWPNLGQIKFPFDLRYWYVSFGKWSPEISREVISKATISLHDRLFLKAAQSTKVITGYFWDVVDLTLLLIIINISLMRITYSVQHPIKWSSFLISPQVYNGVVAKLTLPQISGKWIPDSTISPFSHFLIEN